MEAFTQWKQWKRGFSYVNVQVNGQRDVQLGNFRCKERLLRLEGADFYYKSWVKSTKSCVLLPQNFFAWFGAKFQRARVIVIVYFCS